MMGGLPEQLTALTGEASAAQPGAFSAIMRWRDGAQGVFLCNNNSGSRREEYVFHGAGITCSVTDSGVTFDLDREPSSTLALNSVGDGVEAKHDALSAIRSSSQPPHAIDTIAPSLFLSELIEAGFSGRVQLPVAEVAAIRQPREAAGKSVLVRARRFADGSVPMAATIPTRQPG